MSEPVTIRLSRKEIAVLGAALGCASYKARREADEVDGESLQQALRDEAADYDAVLKKIHQAAIEEFRDE